jgi:hypothetical protein
MPSDEEFAELKGRIVELENLLSQRAAVRQDMAALTPEELQAFAKVRDLMAADTGGFCGINDCFRCVISHCVTTCIARCIQCAQCIQCIQCVQCIFECTCGPCLASQGGGGVGRFSGLGG